MSVATSLYFQGLNVLFVGGLHAGHYTRSVDGQDRSSVPYSSRVQFPERSFVLFIKNNRPVFLSTIKEVCIFQVRNSR